MSSTGYSTVLVEVINVLQPRIIGVVFSFMCLYLASDPREANAQCDSCTVIRAHDAGGYTIEISGRRYRAITEDQMRQLLTLNQRLQEADSMIKLKDALLSRYDTIIGQYEATLTAQNIYAAQLDSLYRGYKEVAAGYKRLSGEPLLSIEAGLGLTGSDTKPSLLAGIGVWRFRVWGFFQENNSGALFGINWRIF